MFNQFMRFLWCSLLLRNLAEEFIHKFFINKCNILLPKLAIIRQIVDVYDRAGKAANYQHLTILAEMMTVDGHLISIDRHGMKKSKTDPLPSASFEKTVDVLLSAAVFGETDHMRGISSRIMTGQVIKGGTGMCDLLLDTEMIEKSEFTEDIGQKYIKTYNEITTSSIISDVINLLV